MRNCTMRWAKVTSNGRVTIPVDVRRDLGARPGDSVDFVCNASGRYELFVRRGESADLRGTLRGEKAVGTSENDR